MYICIIQNNQVMSGDKKKISDQDKEYIKSSESSLDKLCKRFNVDKKAGRPKIEGGKIMQVIATPDEIRQIKQLLKEIRSNGKKI